MAGLGSAGAGAARWGSFDDDDDWGLSEEQLDRLEQDAYRKLAERKASSSTASTAPPTSPLPHRALSPATVASSPLRNDHPASRVSLESRFGKVESLSPPWLSQPTAVNNSQGSSPKISVNLFLHSSAVIAAKFPYHQKLVNAFHKIPKASWNGKERLPTGSDYLGELEADEPLEGAPQLEKLVPIKVLNFDGDGAQMVLLRSLLLKAPGLAKLLLISRRRGELQEPQVLDDLTTVQIVLRKDDDTDTEPVHSREAEF